MWYLLGGGKRSSHRVLLGKPEGRKLLGKPRYIWECNIKRGVKKIRREGVEWIDLAQDGYKWQALVNAAIALNAYHFLTERETSKFSSRTLFHGDKSTLHPNLLSNRFMICNPELKCPDLFY